MNNSFAGSLEPSPLGPSVNFNPNKLHTFSDGSSKLNVESHQKLKSSFTTPKSNDNEREKYIAECKRLLNGFRKCQD